MPSRQFSIADQDRFARLSGDYNPLHLDPVAARRTLMGRPVVHGIHTLLWVLENLPEDCWRKNAGVAAIAAEFLRPAFLDETVTATAQQRGDGRTVVTVTAGSVRLARVVITFGPTGPDGTDCLTETLPHDRARDVARDLPLEALANSAGRLPLCLAPEARDLFPAAITRLGAARVAGLLALSRLVGMECPGLSSVFSSLKLDFTAGAGPVLDWHVRAVDDRFRLVSLTVEAAGLRGSVEAFHRPPPQPQASLAEVAAEVLPAEFAGQRALVVGGSRGLGEVVAKIIAAGGGEVVVTHAAGAADARRVAEEIGPRCRVLALDVLIPAGALDSVVGWTTDLYYFATPKIFERRGTAFDPAAFALFSTFYVEAFAAMVETLAGACPHLGVLCPSSAAVDEPLPQLMEYAAAKAASETLCHGLARRFDRSRFVVPRLPRLATDQTVTMDGFPAESPLAAMLPLVRKLHALRLTAPLV